MKTQNKTRILGIILLAIGAITIKYFGGASIAFFIPGLIMLASNTKTAEKELKKFIASLKLIKEKKYFVIALYDMLCWFGIIIATFGLGTTINKKITQNFVPDLSTALSLLTMTTSYLIALIMISIIIYSIFRGLIWLTILNKKPDWNYFKKFTILNLIWIVIWAIFTIILALGIQPMYWAYIIILWSVLFIHLTSVMHYSYTKKPEIGLSLKNAFRTGIGKIPKFLLPYAYMTLVYLIIIQVFWILPRTQKTMVFATVLIIAFYMAWYRQYLASALNDTKFLNIK